MDFQGKVCVVTGASSGIGERVARDLAAVGARVCAVARREERLKVLIAELPGRGHTYKVTDVSEREPVADLARFVGDTYGRCDVLINNAGISSEGGFDGPPSVAALEKIMRTNFLGAVWCTAELLELLLASAPSHVVNVASIAGRLAAGSSAYVSSKFALAGWSESMHFQLAPKGVFVSSVEPGIIPTEGFPATAVQSHPVLRFTTGTTEQVARAILDAIEHRKFQRVVPRWYYLLIVARILMPPVYRFVQRRIVLPMFERNRRAS